MRESIDSGLIDRIYEAGVNPSCWPAVLEEISTISSSRGAVLVHWDGVQQGWIASSNDFADFVSDHYQIYPDGNERTRRLLELNHFGFVSDNDVFSDQEILDEPLYKDFLIPRGYGRGVATAINSPSGESMIFHTEGSYRAEPVDRSIVRELDHLRPHLARASFLTTCLNKERAYTAASILEVLGLPGALIKGKGKLVACNRSFERLIPVLFEDFQQQISLTDFSANQVFVNALHDLNKDSNHQLTRSILVAVDGLEEKHIVHIIPIKKTAHDFFPVASAVILAVPINRETTFPAEIIQGLFDLTAAEAKVAESIAQGLTPLEIANQRGISTSTVRNQLKSVFNKSGTHRQTDLVRMLNGVIDIGYASKS